MPSPNPEPQTLRRRRTFDLAACDIRGENDSIPAYGLLAIVHGGDSRAIRVGGRLVVGLVHTSDFCIVSKSACVKFSRISTIIIGATAYSTVGFGATEITKAHGTIPKPSGSMSFKGASGDLVESRILGSLGLSGL